MRHLIAVLIGLCVTVTALAQPGSGTGGYGSVGPGGAGATNGLSSAQVQSAIKTSNDTVFASLYIGRTNGSGQAPTLDNPKMTGVMQATNIVAIPNGVGHDNLNISTTNGTLTINTLSNVTVSGSNQVLITSGGIPGGISMDTNQNITIFPDSGNIYGSGITFNAPGNITFAKNPVGLEFLTNGWPWLSNKLNFGAFVTPLFWGALGDDSHDDSTALQKALDYVALSNNSPAVLFLPPGTYKITTPLLLRSNADSTINTYKAYSIYGVPGKTQIHYTATNINTAAVQFKVLTGDAGSHLNKFTVYGVDIVGAGNTNNWADGIFLGYDQAITHDTSDTPGWDNKIDLCKISKFHTGVYISHMVNTHLVNDEVQGDWWTSVTGTNADTTLVVGGAYGSPQLGVDNNFPLTFTNLAAFNLWLGTGFKVTGIECGGSSRMAYIESTPVSFDTCNIELLGVEGIYNESFASSVFSNLKFQNIGDATSNAVIFHLLNGGEQHTTIISPMWDGTERLVAEDTIYGYYQPHIFGVNVAGVAPARYNASYIPLYNFSGTHEGDGSGLTNLNVLTAFSNAPPASNSLALQTNLVLSVSRGMMFVFDGGTDAFGRPTGYLTNSSSFGGGGSQTPWASDINAAKFKLINPTYIIITNKDAGSADSYIEMFNYHQDGGVDYSGTVLEFTGQSNGVAATSVLKADVGAFNYADIATNLTDLRVLGHVDAGSGFYTSMTVTGPASATSYTANGGDISLIPTNASPVLTFANVNASLPFGITNTLAGRAQPVVQYYLVDGASGTPIMTISNETTGVKLRISSGPLASLSQTNFTTLPITTTNTIWKIRDESTGSGASVGIITNWLIGL